MPTVSDIERAAQAIAPHVRRTPNIEIPGSTMGLDATLVFKLEFLQVTGAFKARGARRRGRGLRW